MNTHSQGSRSWESSLADTSCCDEQLIGAGEP